MTPDPIHYREYLPCSALAPYVRAYFTFSNDRRRYGDQKDSHPVCPALFADCGTSLIIKLSGAWHVDGLAATQTDQCSGVVIGPITSGRTTHIGKGVDAIGAYFFPGALARFTELPLAGIANDALPIEEVFGAAGYDCMAVMCDSLNTSMNTSIRLTQLEWLLMRAAIRNGGVLDPRVRKLCALLTAGSPFSVERAAMACGVTRQYMSRLFRAQVGATPKAFARVTRLKRVLQRLNDSRRLDSTHLEWADISAQFGYVDQSHLIAEFREFTTLTPGAFIGSRRFHPFVA